MFFSWITRIKIKSALFQMGERGVRNDGFLSGARYYKKREAGSQAHFFLTKIWQLPAFGIILWPSSWRVGLGVFRCEHTI